MTHYIPAFTTRVRDNQQAVCGEFVDARQHSNEPDCLKCAAWLIQEAVEDAQTIKALEAEYPKFAGKIGGAR